MKAAVVKALRLLFVLAASVPERVAATVLTIKSAALPVVKSIGLLAFFVAWKSFTVFRVAVRSLIHCRDQWLPRVSRFRLGQYHSCLAWMENRSRVAYKRSRRGIVLPLRVTLLLLLDRRGLLQWPRSYRLDLGLRRLTVAQWLSEGLSEEQVKSAMKMLHESSEAHCESLW